MDKVKYLALENGKVFKGRSFGFDGEAVGETVFSTGVTGYLEMLTDKCCYGQIVVQTFPQIGNYGIIPADFESGRAYASGYIVNSQCQEPSNFRSVGAIDIFLREQKIPGIYGINTRALTKTIRDHGTLKGAIVDDPDKISLLDIAIHEGPDPIKAVQSPEPGKFGKGDYHVVAVDYGMRNSTCQELTKAGLSVSLLGGLSTSDEILAKKPDGVVLPDGPGDPENQPELIKTVKKLIESGVPIFGIGLGHQLLALASGFKTYKLKFGHRGSNQPVKELATGAVHITRQNHGYCVERYSIDPSVARESFVNINDGTCEGLEFIGKPIFSVQFSPEHRGGSNSPDWLFRRFIRIMKSEKKA